MVAGLPLSSLRCEPAPPWGGLHLLCPGMLPAWVEVPGGAPKRVFEMLGPVHFLDGSPAEGRAFARTLLAMRAPAAENSRDARLSAAVAQAIAALEKGGDARARVVGWATPGASAKVTVVLDQVRVGLPEPAGPRRVTRRAGALLEFGVTTPLRSFARSRWVEARVEAPEGEGAAASAEAMLTPLGDRLTEALFAEAPSLLLEADEDRALAALHASKRKPSPGHERLEALAFDVAGARLGDVIARGVAASHGYFLPLTPPPDASSCLVAVAIADPLSAHVRLSTESGSHLDARGLRESVIEICDGEGRAPGDRLQLTTEGATFARWALFASHPSISND